MDLNGPLPRPVPVPFSGVPKRCDAAVEGLLRGIGAVEVLTCGEEALHEERGFDEVSTVVEHAEEGHRRAAVSARTCVLNCRSKGGRGSAY